jgi:hypothetical protein
MVRFWLKVEVPAGFTGCWLWTGALTRSGYGRMAVNEYGEPKRLAQAHRVAWELFNGSIPEGLNVLHQCDTPPCVNPGHLFLGTQADNVADMVTKGRHGHGRVVGEEHPRAKLSAAQVAEIRVRHAAGETGRILAREFGVGDSQMSRIVRGQSWA